MRVEADFPEFGFTVEAEAIIEKSTRDYPGSVDFEDHTVFVLVKSITGSVPQVASDELRDMILERFESEIIDALSDALGDTSDEDEYDGSDE